MTLGPIEFAAYPTDRTALRILPPHLAESFWEAPRGLNVGFGEGWERQRWQIDTLNPSKGPVPDWLREAIPHGSRRTVNLFRFRDARPHTEVYETQLHALAVALILALAKRAWEPGMGITAPEHPVVEEIDRGPGWRLCAQRWPAPDLMFPPRQSPSTEEAPRRLFWKDLPLWVFDHPERLRLSVSPGPPFAGGWVSILDELALSRLAVGRRPCRVTITLDPEPGISDPMLRRILARNLDEAYRVTFILGQDGDGDAMPILQLLTKLAVRARERR